MVPFGRKQSGYAGSGLDKPEPKSLVRRWHIWVMDFLKPMRRAPTENFTEQPSPARGRRHIERRGSR